MNYIEMTDTIKRFYCDHCPKSYKYLPNKIRHMKNCIPLIVKLIAEKDEEPHKKVKYEQTFENLTVSEVAVKRPEAEG